MEIKNTIIPAGEVVKVANGGDYEVYLRRVNIGPNTSDLNLIVGGPDMIDDLGRSMEYSNYGYLSCGNGGTSQELFVHNPHNYPFAVQAVYVKTRENAISKVQNCRVQSRKFHRIFHGEDKFISLSVRTKVGRDWKYSLALDYLPEEDYSSGAVIAPNLLDNKSFFLPSGVNLYICVETSYIDQETGGEVVEPLGEPVEVTITIA